MRTLLAKGFYLPAINHNVAARVENQEKVREEGDQVAPESFTVHQLPINVVRRNLNRIMSTKMCASINT